MIKVFYTDISPLSNITEGFILSQYRLKRLENISNTQKRKESIAAELLLNYAVAQAFPQLKPPFEIVEGEFGKPAFKNIPLYFSISHSGNTVACALADSDVGLDVEENIKHRPEVAARFFTEAEQGRLTAAHDKNREFARIWTAKESALKLIGMGLRRSTLDVHTERDAVTLKPENDKLCLTVFETDRLVLSLCTRSFDDAVVLEFVEL